MFPLCIAVNFPYLRGRNPSVISENQCSVVLTFNFNICALHVLKVLVFSFDNCDVTFLSHLTSLFVSRLGFSDNLVGRTEQCFLFLFSSWLLLMLGTILIQIFCCYRLVWAINPPVRFCNPAIFSFLTANYCRHMCFSYCQSLPVQCEYFALFTYIPFWGRVDLCQQSSE